MELKGTTAIITGSTGRLGGAIAKAVASAGCNCICHYNSNEEAAQKLAGRLVEMGRKAIRHAAGPDKLGCCFFKTAVGRGDFPAGAADF